MMDSYRIFDKQGNYYESSIMREYKNYYIMEHTEIQGVYRNYFQHKTKINKIDVVELIINGRREI